jgi:hypothetical protein
MGEGDKFDRSTALHARRAKRGTSSNASKLNAALSQRSKTKCCAVSAQKINNQRSSKEMLHISIKKLQNAALHLKTNWLNKE